MIERLAIRTAAPDDVGTIVDFNRALARETEDRDLDPARVTAGVAALLADPAKGRYFLATREARIVGQLMLTEEWSDWRNGMFWWIQSVYVHADARRDGVFRRLFEHVHALAENDAGVCGLRLYVDHDNRRAQETYRHLGAALTDYALMEWDFSGRAANPSP